VVLLLLLLPSQQQVDNTLPAEGLTSSSPSIRVMLLL
jgi:hypothetical protein